MSGLQRKSLRSPDDSVVIKGLDERSVELGEQTIGRAIIQPGWRWSVDLQPVVGSPTCDVRHLGVCLSGVLHVQMNDGHAVEIGPDDVFDIPPGHDAWVVGDQPFQSVEIAGIYGYGRQAGGGAAYVTSILLTDVVSSTSEAERLGPDAWKRLLAAHYASARRALDRHNGVEISTTGDGILATFDGAARAVRAAAEIHAGAEQLGIQVRAGIHTGEVEAVPGNIQGLAVHIAARIAAAAQPGETYVSSTTREVISAADVVFENRGSHELKGVTGPRQLFSVRIGSAGPSG
jgi:class 3 adenylate cyclase